MRRGSDEVDAWCPRLSTIQKRFAYTLLGGSSTHLVEGAGVATLAFSEFPLRMVIPGHRHCQPEQHPFYGGLKRMRVVDSGSGQVPTPTQFPVSD